MGGILRYNVFVFVGSVQLAVFCKPFVENGKHKTLKITFKFVFCDQL